MYTEVHSGEQVVGYQSLGISHWWIVPGVMGIGLGASGLYNGLFCNPCTTLCLLRIAYCLLMMARHYRLANPYCQLHLVNCQLFFAYCLLFISQAAYLA